MYKNQALWSKNLKMNSCQNETTMTFGKKEASFTFVKIRVYDQISSSSVIRSHNYCVRRPAGRETSHAFYADGLDIFFCMKKCLRTWIFFYCYFAEVFFLREMADVFAEKLRRWPWNSGEAKKTQQNSGVGEVISLLISIYIAHTPFFPAKSLTTVNVKGIDASKANGTHTWSRILKTNFLTNYPSDLYSKGY